ncbi:MAG: glycosyltransferase family 1 protein [Candidatus Moraniibacteriota bacterium]
MSIAIQASDLDHERIDGTRVYLSMLLKRFGSLAPDENFTLYHQRGFNPALAPPAFSNYAERIIPFPLAWMQTRFALEMFRERPKKIFLPIQAAPYFLPTGTEVTVTVHDLAFKIYPETFPKTHVIKLNLFLDWAVARANKIIAVSESTKRDLLRFFPKVLESKIRVISHGFDADLFGTRLAESELSEKLKNHKLDPQRYCLSVGALQPRKNLSRLIEAFTLAKEKAPDMKLVLAGERAWLSDAIFATWEKSAFKDDIIFTGQVSFEELRALYQGARFFVFPSLYEGFGIPILEAFASGVPVLAASNSSLPEVAGDAALYCDAKSVSSIAENMGRLWNEEALRMRLVEKGRKQMGKFSWDLCARETLSFIGE